MKLRCPCGAVILDVTNAVPAKAHLIPDEQWLSLLDGLDRIIESVAENRLKPDAAYMEVRKILKTRLIYQCQECGRLFVDDRHHKEHVFAPSSDETGKRILEN